MEPSDVPDLNNRDETTTTVYPEEELCREPPNVSCENDIEVLNEVEATNVTIEDMERRLTVGHTVENEDMAYALYCRYASLKGFKVRKGRSIRFKDGCGLVQGKYFLCSCEGFKDNKGSKDNTLESQDNTSRCGCEAKLKVARKKGTEWRVTTFKKEHNHEMGAPDQAFLIRPIRNLTDEQQLLMSAMVKAKIPLSRAIQLLENTVHGGENSGFAPNDASNSIRKTKVEDGDVLELVQHLVKKKNSESDFYWNMEVDNDKRLSALFFRDSVSLSDYACFSDVLSIDTSYKMNDSDSVYAIFVGINHHNENIMFGFAFMSDQMENSFEWLLRTFLESMGGKQPGMVLTDQSGAMVNAVEKVFPDAHPRLGHWYISQNAPSFFGILNKDSNFKSLWDKCMNRCDSEEEFETTWKQMMANDGIVDHTWFNIMYDLKHKWASVFSNDIFSAGLMSTSKSKSSISNSALEKQLENGTSLLCCVLGYEELQNSWRSKQKEKDTPRSHTKHAPSNPFLKHPFEVYSFTIFQLFEKELRATVDLKHPQQINNVDSTLKQFTVSLYGSSSTSKVEYDSTKMEVKCSCHKFETFGILCGHILKVLDALDLHVMVEKYVKKRWTKNAKDKDCVEESLVTQRENDCVDDEMAFVNHITSQVHDLAMQAQTHVEARNILTNAIASARIQMSVLHPDISNGSARGVKRKGGGSLVDHHAPLQENIDVRLPPTNPLPSVSELTIIRQPNYPTSGYFHMINNEYPFTNLNSSQGRSN